MNKFKYSLAAIFLASFPFLAEAATDKKLSDLIALAISYLNQAILLFMGFAVAAFVYYIVKYFILPHDNRTEAGQYVMWSLIGFFIILSMWGLVHIVVSTFDLGTNNPSSWADIKNIFPQ